MSTITKMGGKRIEANSHDYFVERPSLNPFTKLSSIFSKNLRLILRSRISSLIFILGPLLIIALLALAFNTSTLFDLNIAAYSSDYSQLSEDILTNLTDNQYNVIKFNSEDECVNAVKTKNFQVCVIFPPHMLLDNSANNIIRIYVDNSRLNIANLISSQISTKLSVESSSLSTNAVSQILSILDETNKQSAENANKIDTLLQSNTEIGTSVQDLNTKLNALDFSHDDADKTAITSEIKSIEKANNITLSTLNGLIKSLEENYEGKLDAAKISIIELPTTDVTDKVTENQNSLNEIKSSVQTVQTSIGTVKITNVANIVAPIKTRIEPISSSNSYLLYILPTILVLLIMLVGILMSSTMIIAEKESKAYFRNFITPTHDSLFFIGELLSNLFIIAIQTGIILLVLSYFIVPMVSLNALFSAGIALLLIATLFISMGMLFGYLFNTKQTVSLAGISAAVIMLFFSNTILPLETLSTAVRDLLWYNPFILGETALKNILLFNSSIQETALPLYFIALWTIVLIVLAVLARKLSKNYTNRA